MPFSAFVGFLNMMSSLVLGIFVFLQRPRDGKNRSYLFFNFSIALYSVGYMLWGYSSDGETALSAFRILTTGIILINSAYLQFVFA